MNIALIALLASTLLFSTKNKKKSRNKNKEKNDTQNEKSIQQGTKQSSESFSTHLPPSSSEVQASYERRKDASQETQTSQETSP